MSQHIDVVKSQSAFHERMGSKFKSDPYRQNKHLETSKRLAEAALYFESLEERLGGETASPKGKGPLQLSLSFKEIEGLPKELLEELSVSDGDFADFTILKIIETAGGIASLDRILVQYYRETGEVMKRATMTSRIYRMTKNGILFAVPGKKGVYATEDLSESDLDKLLSK